MLAFPRSRSSASSGRRALSLAILFAAFAQADARAGLALGEASNYNLFAFNHFYQQGADVEGRIAVGGNADIKGGFGAAQNIPGSNPVDDRLVVGGNLSWDGSGRVFNNGVGNGLGNIRVGGTAAITPGSVSYNQLNTGSPSFSFAAAEQMLRDSSAYWGGLAPNGTAQNQWGGLTLTGTNSDLVVFSLNASNLNGINNLSFEKIPANATVLVNVVGEAINMTGFGFNLNGLLASKVLFNFVNAKTINIANAAFNASILAPDATLTFSSGQINGNVIVKNVGTPDNRSTGQFNAFNGAIEYLFKGDLPPTPNRPPVSAVPEPGSLGLAGVGAALLVLWRRKRARVLESA